MYRGELFEKIEELLFKYEEETTEFVSCGIIFENSNDKLWVFNGECFEVKDER